MMQRDRSNERIAWQTIKRGDMPSGTARFSVSVNTRGFITMNKWTFAHMGKPPAFQILFDKGSNRIGLKPCGFMDKNAYPVKGYNRHGAKMIRAYRLLLECGIDLPHTMQFNEVYVGRDGVLILELHSASISKRSLAYQKRVPKDAKPAETTEGRE